MKRLRLALQLGLLLACQSHSDADPDVEHARFGIFFGGQIQDRKELPFELDQTKQRVGFRIDFRNSVARPLKVRWEIARPLAAHSSASDAGGEQVVEVGESAARLGESRLDVPISFRQGQVLGTWHVSVQVEGRSVIDRDLLVFDPRERRERDVDVGH